MKLNRYNLNRFQISGIEAEIFKFFTGVKTAHKMMLKLTFCLIKDNDLKNGGNSNSGATWYFSPKGSSKNVPTGLGEGFKIFFLPTIFKHKYYNCAMSFMDAPKRILNFMIHE